MARISIIRRHQLSHKQAKVVAEKLAKDLQKRCELAWQWDGDHVLFERPGVTGSIHVGKNEIRLEAKLGLLLSALKPAIEREIHEQLETLTAPQNRA